MPQQHGGRTITIVNAEKVKEEETKRWKSLKDLIWNISVVRENPEGVFMTIYEMMTV